VAVQQHVCCAVRVGKRPAAARSENMRPRRKVSNTAVVVVSDLICRSRGGGCPLALRSASLAFKYHGKARRRSVSNSFSVVPVILRRGEHVFRPVRGCSILFSFENSSLHPPRRLGPLLLCAHYLCSCALVPSLRLLCHCHLFYCRFTHTFALMSVNH
jgi:hypothetical protein